MGIIGFGWVARDYMYPAITNAPDVNLIAVCSICAEDMDGLPKTIQRFTSTEEMIENVALDAVYIATPNFAHCDPTCLCLRHGIHVLCEKPMATCIEDAERMAEAASLSSAVYQTAYDQRYHPAHLYMKRKIDQGYLGTITQARIDYACWLDKDWASDNWRIDRTKAGGGAIIDLAPHGLDLLETILNDTIVNVTLLAQNCVQEYDVDDGGVGVMQFRKGTLASVHVGYNRPESLPRRTLEIIGTEGKFTARNTMGQVAGGQLKHIDAQTRQVETVEFNSKLSPFENQLHYFISYIRNPHLIERTAKDDVRLFELLYHQLQNQF